MKEVLFYIWGISAIIMFLYLYVFATVAVIHYAKELSLAGMKFQKKPFNWAVFFMGIMKSALFILVPVVNTFFAILFICFPDSVLTSWKKSVEEYFQKT